MPSGTTFILADENGWGTDGPLVADRTPIPFLEHNGQYWGRPQDDITAIHELERLRRDGASFMVFAWPAFWWFDYYKGFHSHLRTQFPCIWQDERIVVFDLRKGSRIQTEFTAGEVGWIPR